LETMDTEEAVTILKILPPSLSAKMFRYLQVDQAAALLMEIPPDNFKGIVEKLDKNKNH